MIYKKPLFWVLIAIAVIATVVGLWVGIGWLKGASDHSISDVGGVDGPDNIVVQTKVKFNATVLETYEKSILVKPVEGSNELNSSDKISVSLYNLSAESLPQIKPGDRVCIEYSGVIAESYPAQIFDVYAISVINK